MAAIKAVKGIFANPVAPKAIIVKNGPSLNAMIEVAPTSVASHIRQPKPHINPHFYWS